MDTSLLLICEWTNALVIFRPLPCGRGSVTLFVEGGRTLGGRRRTWDEERQDWTDKLPGMDGHAADEGTQHAEKEPEWSKVGGQDPGIGQRERQEDDRDDTAERDQPAGFPLHAIALARDCAR